MQENNRVKKNCLYRNSVCNDKAETKSIILEIRSEQIFPPLLLTSICNVTMSMINSFTVKLFCTQLVCQSSISHSVTQQKISKIAVSQRLKEDSFCFNFFSPVLFPGIGFRIGFILM